jgi:hypothetical protein
MSEFCRTIMAAAPRRRGLLPHPFALGDGGDGGLDLPFLLLRPNLLGGVGERQLNLLRTVLTLTAENQQNRPTCYEHRYHHDPVHTQYIGKITPDNESSAFLSCE